MKLVKFSVSLGAFLLVTLLAGCGGSRESALVGKWNVSPTFGIMSGIKASESASSAQAAAQGAIALANITIDMREDKTFAINMSNTTLSGNWTFEEDSGQTTLNINKVEIPQAHRDRGDKPIMESGVWSAKLDDDDNNRFVLQMAAPGALAAAAGEAAAAKAGIPFVKQ